MSRTERAHAHGLPVPRGSGAARLHPVAQPTGLGQVAQELGSPQMPLGVGGDGGSASGGGGAGLPHVVLGRGAAAGPLRSVFGSLFGSVFGLHGFRTTASG